ncbi:YacL family protein [Vibrio sp. SM6]|uniref:UPF0231 protein HGP28_07570 n=1 Tax=Vibrio agarilyticus TaxID=2726741 RepID=A0A7X8TR88_9VIBR|nr:YacL family protein [Vibrio agarilyticus]NLS12763.1 YacL family protein [Vibrio agarilyticus]
MEFEFTKNTLLGEYYVKCSMDHEVVGRWLQDEIGTDRTKLQQLVNVLLRARTNPAQETRLSGREISLLIAGDEVTVAENALAFESDLLTDEFDYYDCESQASCGLDDFEQLIQRWCEFIGWAPNW